MRAPCKSPTAGTRARASSWADDNSRPLSNKSFLYRCKSAGPMSGPLWQMTLAYTARFYIHTNPVSATRAPMAARLRPTTLVGTPKLIGKATVVLQTVLSRVIFHHLPYRFVGRACIGRGSGDSADSPRYVLRPAIRPLVSGVNIETESGPILRGRSGSGSCTFVTWLLWPSCNTGTPIFIRLYMCGC